MSLEYFFSPAGRSRCSLAPGLRATACVFLSCSGSQESQLLLPGALGPSCPITRTGSWWEHDAAQGLSKISLCHTNYAGLILPLPNWCAISREHPICIFVILCVGYHQRAAAFPAPLPEKLPTGGVEFHMDQLHVAQGCREEENILLTPCF